MEAVVDGKTREIDPDKAFIVKAEGKRYAVAGNPDQPIARTQLRRQAIT
jgi:hypothetical protein